MGLILLAGLAAFVVLSIKFLFAEINAAFETKFLDSSKIIRLNFEGLKEIGIAPEEI